MALVAEQGSQLQKRLNVEANKCSSAVPSKYAFMRILWAYTV
jgi:hypothetical protein